MALTKFCSMACRSAASRITLLCMQCGKSIIRRRSTRRARRIFCSIACARKFNRGINNRLWRNSRQNGYRGTDWPSVSAAVRIRDKFTCQVTGQKQGSKAFPVDHIIPFCLCRSNQMLNLLTVSESVHSSKTPLEQKLIEGDRLGFESGLREIGYPMDKVTAALDWWMKEPQLQFTFRPSRKRTHCKRGHELTTDNLLEYEFNGRLQRQCKLCVDMRRHPRKYIDIPGALHPTI